MEDLRALNVSPPQPHAPAILAPITTPLRADAWELCLRGHPDQEFASYLAQGIRHGFRIGFQGSAPPGIREQLFRRNMRSAYEHPGIVNAYLTKEAHLQRIIPLDSQTIRTLPRFMISPFGVIPKRHQQNKWRLIVDLSAPEGRSVNDAIDSTRCSIKYASVDDAVEIIRRLGAGTLMAKIDLRDAYRIVPVHPLDRPLLCTRWREVTYADAALPFGLRSAPKIFSALADGLLWIMQARGAAPSLHYLDDFLLLGPPSSPSCAAALRTTMALCEDLGVPVADEKTEGPATVLTFLGIELDSARMQLRLPQHKLRILVDTLTAWMHPGPLSAPRRSVRKRDLLSLIGHLSHAATVVRPGRTFTRSLIDASTTARLPDHHVHLSALARADIVWWYTFLRSWNGVSLLPAAEPSQEICSDASGTWGCGAQWGGNWLQLPWPQAWAAANIAQKEMVPVLLAVAVWGSQWAGERIRCYSDNAAVVFAINRGTARDQQLMRILRSLFFFCATFDITLAAQHLPGVRNTSADALSRNNLSLFFSLNPQAHSTPAHLSDDIVELALNRSLRWTTPSWTRLFAATLTNRSLPPQRQHTAPHSADTLPSASHGPSHPPSQQARTPYAALQHS